ncbi:hypothetical protein PYW08_013077 [Mythimna loreyi]|uniref:Uncharacterized protein n=1 Tax=Mythimna loreyi TaxID=667449 RepID=A0ACC2PZU7_9NEOP|nr:hypothetical protein PYW08_013077 [Mythimna loreyi]
MDQTKSEPDIAQALNEPEFININSRNTNKRQRLNQPPRVIDPLDQFEQFKQDFKSDIKEMLLSWKAEQDANVEKQFLAQKELIGKLVSEVSELKLQNMQIQNTGTVIQETNIEIKKSIEFLSSKYDDLQKEIKRLQQENIEYKKHAESLELAVRDLQYKSRSSSIEVRNVPIQEMESSADLTKIVTAIANLVNLPLTPSHFRDIYRITGNRGTSKPIIAEFTNVQTKIDLISKIRTYNNKKTNREDKLNTELIGISGQKQAVFVDEHLSNTNKKLFYQAREFARLRKYAFCWTSNGNVFIRKQAGDKQILVKSETTLREIQD